MVSKRAWSEDTNGSATRIVVEQVSASLPIYEYTKLIIDKDIKMEGLEVNDAFVGTYGENLEDYQVYVNIHKSNLY